MKILGTGLSGLVGTQLTALLKKKYQFQNISRSEGIDITNKESIYNTIAASEAPLVLHLAGKTNVDLCEQDKEADQEFINTKSSTSKDTAWAINVFGTKNVVDACQKTGKKILYVSTDFVFDGKNCPENGYSEEDVPSPINWYGVTKYEGEKIVKNADCEWLIMRIAYPYSSNPDSKDFVHAIGNKLKSGEGVSMIEDHVFTPTHIADIALAIDALLKNNQSGIFHIVGSQFLSPYEAGKLMSRSFGFNSDLIDKTTRSEFFLGHAVRPFQLKLRNDKIRRLGIEMKTFEEGLIEIKKQIDNKS